MHAVCSDCKKLADLQICFDCKYTLCQACIDVHFKAWKSSADAKCHVTEEKLKSYNKQIGSCQLVVPLGSCLSPYLLSTFVHIISDQFSQRSVKNLEYLNKVEADIQSQYNKLMQDITNERDELFKKVYQAKMAK